MPIDLEGEFGKRVRNRLEHESVVWLTTVRANGTPEPSPVWFYWDGSKILLRSKPTVKARNIEANPHVTLNFDSEGGGNVVVITGTARIAAEDDFGRVRDRYFAKYAEQIKQLGTSVSGMTSSYSVVLEIEPTKLRGH